jgi:rhodanese-related sulfurtransferase
MPKKYKNLYFIIILIISMGILSFLFKSNNSSKYTNLNSSEFLSEVNGKKCQLIDVRTPAEFNSGTIKNAKNINIMSLDFANRISKLDKNEPVYVFCRSGSRSAKACNILAKNGFTKLYNLSGGVMSLSNNQLTRGK